MEISEFRQVLCSFLENSGMSKNELAKKSKVSQSQISNWSSGGGVRFTKNASRVLKKIDELDPTRGKQLSPELEGALVSLLNGERDREQAIKKVLFSLRDVFTT